MKTINDYIKLDLYKIDYKQVLNNYSILIIGLFIMSFGVALSVRSNLGTTPISCIPYVLSFKFPLSLGTITILFNTLLIIIQILILRSNSIITNNCEFYFWLFYRFLIIFNNKYNTNILCDAMVYLFYKLYYNSIRSFF